MDLTIKGLSHGNEDLCIVLALFSLWIKYLGLEKCVYKLEPGFQGKYQQPFLCILRERVCVCLIWKFTHLVELA